MQRGRSIKKIILLLGILICACALMGQKSAYIWTDEEGNPHISDQKPSGTENVQEMKYATPQREGAEKDDSFYRSQVEDKAKEAEDLEKNQKQAQVNKKKEEYEKLKAEEKISKIYVTAPKTPLRTITPYKSCKRLKKKKANSRDRDSKAVSRKCGKQEAEKAEGGEQ